MKISFLISLLKTGLLMLMRPWLWSVRPLRISDLLDNPIDQFEKWFNRAKRCLSLEFPEAMCLSTLGTDGYPEGRMVLLKSFSAAGFVFYTNILSQKGRSLAQLPRAALTMYWEPLQRQVRIVGDIEAVTPEEADTYFATRIRGSRIGAWASLQSEALPSRSVLDKRVEQYTKLYKNKDVPRPPHWSGFRLKPIRIEFWQLRANRLHDRFLYTKTAKGVWEKKRLYP